MRKFLRRSAGNAMCSVRPRLCQATTDNVDIDRSEEIRDIATAWKGFIAGDGNRRSSPDLSRGRYQDDVLLPA